ncbi:uncharacterized protein LOC110118024 [Ceratitis capitata]|uniref:uncharacterized protein LOC110118024 n=1 Tax=Ceratitis capitata TaxID=7213 RepID=UPI000A119C17|nr:uncharacterized protein LOC110118024 [Ceratitis capitata]
MFIVDCGGRLENLCYAKFRQLAHHLTMEHLFEKIPHLTLQELFLNLLLLRRPASDVGQKSDLIRQIISRNSKLPFPSVSTRKTWPNNGKPTAPFSRLKSKIVVIT